MNSLFYFNFHPRDIAHCNDRESTAYSVFHWFPGFLTQRVRGEESSLGEEHSGAAVGSNGSASSATTAATAAPWRRAGG
jgi:hypothetical protein